MKFKFETDPSTTGSGKQQFFQKSLHRKDWN
jgi:hypothetical protein